jgi:bacterial/archaeal transporter family protein
MQTDPMQTDPRQTEPRQNDRWQFPLWLWYALLCVLGWGLWGFLSKIGSEAASPLQMQILFTLGMLPVAIGMLLQMRGKLDRNGGGITYGLLSGVATGLGTLGYFAALREQSASVVTPLTGVFPVLTVALAFVVLRERLNKVQMFGMLLALASIVILSI